MTEIRILVAEDDADIREGLADTLESEAYAVVQAGDGRQALDLFSGERFDLVLLDVMMPGVSGYDVCRAIRKQDPLIPILMLTAKGEEIDKVVGLELGADDYMTKPFGIHELLARIHALLRRSAAARQHGKTPGAPLALDREKSAFAFGPFEADPKTYTLNNGPAQVSLSRRELDLLRLFAEHEGEVIEREFILGQVWGPDYPGTTRTLDQHIAKLRKKVEQDPAAPLLITTVHGIGYRYEGS